MSAYLDKYTGSMVCSKQLYKEALNHAFDEPKQWEINEIMNQCISWIFSLIATKATEKKKKSINSNHRQIEIVCKVF